VPLVDAVVVSYNSRDQLRGCVEPLAGNEHVSVIVVDNASPVDGLGTISDLPVRTLRQPRNGGFAYGCNAGWRAGSAPYVLFLNPDARMEPAALLRLVRTLEENPAVGAVGPRIVEPDGSLAFSQRRFPRLRSTYAHALFLNHVFPRADVTDGIVRDPSAYARPAEPDWLSGAAIAIRRTLLERLGGFDEGFFMYREDVDLCRRIRDAGFAVRFEPAATCVHEGGASAPRSALLPVLAASRIRYASKHGGLPAATLERLGIVLSSLTHALVARGGAPVRRGHLRSLRLALGGNSGGGTASA
jgi:N-acetylglucosaminyl-diphospho-decaprenol L-rhamnosyltransferase